MIPIVLKGEQGFSIGLICQDMDLCLSLRPQSNRTIVGEIVRLELRAMVACLVRVSWLTPFTRG